MGDQSAAPGGIPLPSDVARPDGAQQVDAAQHHVQAISDLLDDLPDMAGVSETLSAPAGQSEQPVQASADDAVSDDEPAGEAHGADSTGVDVADFSAVDETLDAAISQVTAIQQQLHGVLTDTPHHPA